MKKYLNFLILFFAVAFSFMFISCGKDDDKEDITPEPPAENTVVGMWRCVDSEGNIAVLNLNADHTGSIAVTIESRASVTLSIKEYFNWNTVDDASANHWLEIIHTGGDYWFEYSSMIYILAGNTLRLDGFVYTRI